MRSGTHGVIRMISESGATPLLMHLDPLFRDRDFVIKVDVAGRRPHATSLFHGVTGNRGKNRGSGIAKTAVRHDVKDEGEDGECHRGPGRYAHEAHWSYQANEAKQEWFEQFILAW